MTKAFHTKDYGDFMPHNIGDTVVKGHDDVKSKIQK
jgi:hypothetical protein